MNDAQEEEYKTRLSVQAIQDINTTGQISPSNQEGLRQIGVTPVVNGVEYPKLPFMDDALKAKGMITDGNNE